MFYGYDRAGNRTFRIEDGDPFTANFNERNQLTSGDFLGNVPFIRSNAVRERVKIIRNPGGSEVERRFIWTGGHQPSQERNASNTVMKRFFAEGEKRRVGSSTINYYYYYYARDHLGSVREMVRSTGSVVARSTTRPMEFGSRSEPRASNRPSASPGTFTMS